MQKYEFSKPTFLYAGNLVLSEDQARRRAHNLKHLEGDVYEIINPVQFKGGEVIGYDGDPPKAVLGGMVLMAEDDRGSNGQAVVEDIMEAIGRLGKENPAHFTRDGKPMVPAIVDVLGENITAAQRDEAWELIQAGK